MGAFSRDEFKRTVSEMDSLLRAAQLYSTTYNVETAVAYSLDNYSSSEAAGGGPVAIVNPIIDSLTGNPVRQIEAAAMLYRVPGSLYLHPQKGQFVPAPGEKGEFKYFPNGMALSLNNPEDSLNSPFYFEIGASNYVTGAADNCICQLGMNQIPVYLEGTGTALFMAHVFQPSSRISVVSACAGCDAERFTLYVTPSADRPLEERLAFPEESTLIAADGKPNILHRKIYIHRSTARVRVPDSQ
jgi:hypothetical protein